MMYGETEPQLQAQLQEQPLVIPKTTALTTHQQFITGIGSGNGISNHRPGSTRHDAQRQDVAREGEGELVRGLRALASSSGATSGAYSDGCSDMLAACGEDSTCLSCLTHGDVNVGECLDNYDLLDTDYVDDGSRSFCETLGLSYCCGAFEMYLEHDLNCVDQDLVVDYWVHTP